MSLTLRILLLYPILTITKMANTCMPKNSKLLGYWDLVADRLFNVRNCMNLQGIVRELALFEPPIDPMLLIKASAAGVDLGSVLSDLDASLPYYKFTVMVAKANEVCNELRGLGSALLTALEKRNAESLLLLRASHEIKDSGSRSEHPRSLRSAECHGHLDYLVHYFRRIRTVGVTVPALLGRIQASVQR